MNRSEYRTMQKHLKQSLLKKSVMRSTATLTVMGALGLFASMQQVSADTVDSENNTSSVVTAAKDTNVQQATVSDDTQNTDVASSDKVVTDFDDYVPVSTFGTASYPTEIHLSSDKNTYADALAAVNDSTTFTPNEVGITDSAQFNMNSIFQDRNVDYSKVSNDSIPDGTYTFVGGDVKFWNSDDTTHSTSYDQFQVRVITDKAPDSSSAANAGSDSSSASSSAANAGSDSSSAANAGSDSSSASSSAANAGSDSSSASSSAASVGSDSSSILNSKDLINASVPANSSELLNSRAIVISPKSNSVNKNTNLSQNMSDKQKVLPQTGENENISGIALGLTGLSVSLLGMFGLRKRQF